MKARAMFLVRPRMLKCVWFVGLLYYVGFFHMFAASFERIFQEESEIIAYEEAHANGVPKIEREAALNRFLLQLEADAKQKVANGGVYSPDNYFSDLRRMDEKQKELHVQAFARIIHNGVFVTLQGLMHESYSHGYTDADLVLAREAYKAYIDPGREGREALDAEIQKKGRLKFYTDSCMSMLRLYVLGLPWAALLFLIWCVTLDTYGRVCMQLPSPCRLLWALARYPYIIAVVWWRYLDTEIDRLLVEASVRQFKEHAFGKLTQKELRVIRAFLHSGESYSNWRTRYNYAQRDSIPRHYLALALFATACCAVLYSFGSEVKNTPSMHIVYSIDNCLCIDCDIGITHTDNCMFHADCLIVPEYRMWYWPFFEPLYRAKERCVVPRSVLDIFHIPLFVRCVLV